MSSLQSRSYNVGGKFRPTPHVVVQPESRILVVTTSWSGRSEAQKVTDKILEQIAFHASGEQTHSAQNSIEAAVAATAQQIYKQENQKQARLAIETLVIQCHDQNLTWAQVGQPNLYLLRKGKVSAVSVQPDLSSYGEALPPLLSNGLGLEPTTKILSGSVRIQESDQILIAAHTHEPDWIAVGRAIDFSNLISVLTESSLDQPFWCGLQSVDFAS